MMKFANTSGRRIKLAFYQLGKVKLLITTLVRAEFLRIWMLIV